MALNFCNNNSLSAITALPASISGGGLNLISTQTASSSSTIDFTSGINSTYKEYIFKFINIHPATDNVSFQFNVSIDGGSNYNVAKTSSAFQIYHNEADDTAGQAYHSSNDLAQGTGVQILLGNGGVGNDNDQSASGHLHLFDPSNVNFVKHYIAVSNFYQYEDYSRNDFVAGYANTTSAINAVQFSMSSGTLDGVIKLYGVS
tara:strand:+ start:252 stop:860 length:609 start_codon:yes stop_codon:yes gene_type:complete